MVLVAFSGVHLPGCLKVTQSVNLPINLHVFNMTIITVHFMGTLIIDDDYRVSKLVMEYVASQSLLII